MWGIYYIYKSKTFWGVGVVLGAGGFGCADLKNSF